MYTVVTRYITYMLLLSKIANQSIKLSCYTVIWLPKFLLLMAFTHLNCFLHLCVGIVHGSIIKSIGRNVYAL